VITLPCKRASIDGNRNVADAIAQLEPSAGNEGDVRTTAFTRRRSPSAAVSTLSGRSTAALDQALRVRVTGTIASA
jgi:hypothetical protein